MDAGSSTSHMSSLAPLPLVARGEASRAAAPAAGRSLVELVREIKAALGSRPAPGKPSFLSSVEAAMAPPPGGGEGSVVVVGNRVEEREALLARLDQPRLLAAMASFDAEPGALRRYSHFAQSKTCARNLIAGDETFSLLLLCWTRGKESPIHDHPSAGCFMRVVSGAVTETLFARDEARNALVELRGHTAHAGDVLFVNDSLGFHKISCSSGDEGGAEGDGEGGVEDGSGKGAVTLHLYVPPFSSCRAWSSADQSLDAPCRPRVTLHSAFGRLVSDAAPEANALSSDGGGSGAPDSAEACLARAERI